MQSFTTMAVVLLALSGLHPVTSRSWGEVRGVLQKCAVPQRFEGKFKMNATAVTASGMRQNAVGVGSVHVDGFNGRAAIFETLYAYGQAIKVNFIMVEAEKGKSTTVYMALPDIQRCMEDQMSQPIIPGIMPENTTITLSEGVFEGVRVQIWDAEFNQGAAFIEGKMQGQAEMYMKRDSCMPMRVYLNVTAAGMSMTGTEYFDAMQEGVSDESVFDIPDYCQVKQENVKRENVKQKHDVIDHERHLEHAAARLQARRHLLF